MSIPIPRSPRTAQFSTACWSCIIRQRRQAYSFSTSSSAPFRSSRTRDSPADVNLSSPLDSWKVQPKPGSVAAAPKGASIGTTADPDHGNDRTPISAFESKHFEPPEERIEPAPPQQGRTFKSFPYKRFPSPPRERTELAPHPQGRIFESAASTKHRSLRIRKFDSAHKPTSESRVRFSAIPFEGMFRKSDSIIRKRQARMVVRKAVTHTHWRKHMAEAGASPRETLNHLLAFHKATMNRQYHTSARNLQETVATPRSDEGLHLPSKTETTMPIRQRLSLWNQEFGVPNPEHLDPFERHPAANGNQRNTLVTLGSKNEEYQDSMDQVDDERAFLDDPYVSSIFLGAGDVVELSGGKSGVARLAVHTQQVDKEMQFYLMDGSYTHVPINQVKFMIPGLIDKPLVEKVLPYLPTKYVSQEIREAMGGNADVPRDLGAPMVNILLQLSRESEKLYRENAAVLDNIYHSFCHPSNTVFITLENIARSLFGPQGPDKHLYEPSAALLLAVRKAIDRSGFKIYSDDKDLRRTGTYMIRPSKEVEAMQLCLDWVREYQEHLASRATSKYHRPPTERSATLHSQGAGYIAKFADKARALVALSRQDRQPTEQGNVGPSKERFPISKSSSAMKNSLAQEFTDADTLIIAFLESWTLATKFAKFGELHSAAAFIINTVGCYPDDQQCNLGTGLLFLQEIGVLVPYENRLAYDEGLMLPTSRFSRQLELINLEAFEQRKNPGFIDTLANLRRDVGKITIYCIDDPSASEIDDGLSVERIPDSEEFWVSIHVANPAAFFDQTHVLAKLAAHMTETVYMPERNYPMMPYWATRKYFSLAPNRPALTFSARMNKFGEVLENKIEATRVRNVKFISPDTISRYFDLDKQTRLPAMVLGGEVQEVPATRPMLDTLPEEDLLNLGNLNMLALARSRQRRNAGGLFIAQSTADVKVYESHGRSGLSWTQPSHERARYVRGDPVIEIHPERLLNMFNEKAEVKSVMVQEMMLLACEIGASWCAERNIPVIFRGTVSNPNSQSLEQFSQSVLKPALTANNEVLPRSVGLQYMSQMGVTVTTSYPMPHAFLGMNQYSKVTSPLRRYGDLVTHWQIQSALLEEARIEKSLVGSKTKKYLTFSEPQIKRLCATIQPRERLISVTQQRSIRFWHAHYYFRALYFNEAPLPETIIVRLESRSQHAKRCWVRDEDTSIVMVMPEPGDGLPETSIGDRWEVKLDSVNMYNIQIWVTPIRLIEREDGTRISG